MSSFYGSRVTLRRIDAPHPMPAARAGEIEADPPSLHAHTIALMQRGLSYAFALSCAENECPMPPAPTTGPAPARWSVEIEDL